MMCVLGGHLFTYSTVLSLSCALAKKVLDLVKFLNYDEPMRYWVEISELFVLGTQTQGLMHKKLLHSMDTSHLLWCIVVDSAPG